MSTSRMIALLAGMVAAILLLNVASAAEPWTITKLTAAYVVNADGSVDATEDYTIDFGSTGARTFNRTVTDATGIGPDYHLIKLTALSVDDGASALPFRRRDVNQGQVIQVGDGTKPFAATQRIRIKYRIVGSVTGGAGLAQFFWDVRGQEPFAVIKNATISVTAPSLLNVDCRQVPVAITSPAIDCQRISSSGTTAEFTTTLELGAPVGLMLWAPLTPGSVTIPPLDRGTLPTQETSTQAEEQAQDEGLKTGNAALSLLAGLAVFGLLVMWRRASAENNPRRFGIVWLAVAWVLTVVNIFLLTANTGFEDWTWAPAELIIGLLIGLTALVVGIIYVRRGGMLDAMRSGENLLAHWTYPAEEWQLYAQGEQATRRSEGKGRLISVAVALVVVCGVALVFDSAEGSEGTSFFTIALVVSAIVMPLVIVANALYLRLADPRSVRTAEAWIALDGVYLQGVMTTWHRGESLAGIAAELALGFGGNKLDDVRLTPGTPHLLEFDYSWWNRRTGTQSATLRVPVPAGNEAWAQNIVAQYKASVEPVPV